MKDCAFQYATGDGVIFEDTTLISRAEAEEIWRRYIPQFKDHVEDGRNPEMAIWVDMDNEDNYHATSMHWCGEDFIVRDGEMFSTVAVA